MVFDCSSNFIMFLSDNVACSLSFDACSAMLIRSNLVVQTMMSSDSKTLNLILISKQRYPAVKSSVLCYD